MNLFEQLILEADAEAAEIEKLKQSSAKIKEIQSAIDKLPDGNAKLEMQKMLDSTIKDLSAREQKTAPKPSAVATPPPTDQAKAQQPAQGQAPQPSAVATPQQEPQVKRAENPYSTDYKGSSIVDFLGKSGQASDFKSRQALAQKMGIADYKGTAEQNTQMLKSLQKQAQDFQKMDQAAQQSQTPAAQTASTPAATTATQQQTPAATTAPQQQAAAQTPTQQPKLTPAQQSVLNKRQNNQNMNRSEAATYASIPSELKPQQQQQQVAQQAPAPKNRAEAAALRDSRFKNSNQTQVAQQPKPQEKSEANEEKIKKCKDCGLNKITVQEKNNISKFLRHLSEKNYSSAHKYLKAIVNSKINKIVSEKIDKI